MGILLDSLIEEWHHVVRLAPRALPALITVCDDALRMARSRPPSQPLRKKLRTTAALTHRPGRFSRFERSHACS